MLNKRKHKRFNYKSRYSKDEINDNVADNASKSDISEEWHKTRRTVSQRKTSAKLFYMLILLGIIIAVMYYLEIKM